jgi:hypothetical protein
MEYDDESNWGDEVENECEDSEEWEPDNGASDDPRTDEEKFSDALDFATAAAYLALVRRPEAQELAHSLLTSLKAKLGISPA